MVSQVERNRNYRQRQRARIAELEAMAGHNITPRNITPEEHNITAMEELKEKLRKLGAAYKAMERENAELKAEIARLESMGSHGAAAEVIEPMGYVMPWEAA